MLKDYIAKKVASNWKMQNNFISINWRIFRFYDFPLICAAVRNKKGVYDPVNIQLTYIIVEFVARKFILPPSQRSLHK